MDSKTGSPKIYYTIKEKRSCEIKIRRSRFICHMCPAKSLEKAKSFISTVSREHPKANHNCWAYIIGDTGDLFHSSDAGEPSGTAGKPMLNTLKKYDMTHYAFIEH